MRPFTFCLRRATPGRAPPPPLVSRVISSKRAGRDQTSVPPASCLRRRRLREVQISRQVGGCDSAGRDELHPDEGRRQRLQHLLPHLALPPGRTSARSGPCQEPSGSRVGVATPGITGTSWPRHHSTTRRSRPGETMKRAPASTACLAWSDGDDRARTDEHLGRPRAHPADAFSAGCGPKRDLRTGEASARSAPARRIAVGARSEPHDGYDPQFAQLDDGFESCSLLPSLRLPR